MQKQSTLHSQPVQRSGIAQNTHYAYPLRIHSDLPENLQCSFPLGLRTHSPEGLGQLPLLFEHRLAAFAGCCDEISLNATHAISVRCRDDCAGAGTRDLYC